MRVAELLTLPLLGRARLVAGRAGLDREVRWTGVVDIPDPHEWLQPGQLLLSTGYAWPRDVEGQRRFVRSLDERGLAALALAVPQFFSEVPPTIVREADAVGLPVLEVPWEIPFARITEETQRALLAEQHRVIERSEAIHRALTQAAVEASSLQEIANVLGELIERDVTFESVSGQLFAASYLPGERDAVRDSTVSQGVTPPEVMAELERGGTLQRLRTQRAPVRVPGVPELGLTPRVACPIRVSGELVGLVWVLEGATPVGELDLRAAEHAATVVALHIAHQQTLAQLESRLGYAFLDSLLDGRLEPTPRNLERARLLGFDWERGHRVGIAVLHDVSLPLSKDGFLRRERLAERLRRRLTDLGGAPFLSVTLNQVSVLLEEGVDPTALDLGPGDEAVGMVWGRAHRGVSGIQRSFREARSLLPHLAAGEVLRYDAWLVPRVLLGDAEARAALLDEVFGPLRAARGGERLVETVVAWSRGGFQGKRAACELGVHGNTVRYRLGRALEGRPGRPGRALRAAPRQRPLVAG
ncbi:MAG: PucR family transcriptional regulator ligand-binding domain-containing protein [Deinococcales bacterium]